jgi:hypothetical protein
MAITKSELCLSPWASCDKRRSGMDAGPYKDCMLSVDHIADTHGFDLAPLTRIEGGNSVDAGRPHFHWDRR